MFVLPSFLEVLTCEQNMIGYWLQTMGLTALSLQGKAKKEFILIVALIVEQKDNEKKVNY